MVIGGYDEDRIAKRGTKRGPNDQDDMTKTDDGIFWMYIKANNFWIVQMFEADLQGSKIEVQNDEGFGEIMINSGVSINYLPEGSYQVIIDKIKETKTCTFKDGIYQCPCTGSDDSSFPTLKILMGSLIEQHWIEMRPQEYLK